MIDNQKYNGWANYATWRVQLELVDDEVRNMLDNDPNYFEDKKDWEIADELKDFVMELISDHVTENENGIGNIIEGYAIAFLEDVDWIELAYTAIELANDMKAESVNA